MPLRDHFRQPVLGRHRWDKLHGGWPMKIVEALQPQLPPRYSAAPQVHLSGAVEIDVATFESHHEETHAAWSTANGGTTTAVETISEPTLRVETDLPDMDEYEIGIYDREREERLVAAIELVSPSNKDRPETRQAFVAKCAALLRQQVSVTIVDVVTTRGFNLYADLLTFLHVSDPTVANPPGSIYASACRGIGARGRWRFEAWHRPLAVGQPLPRLPIWLTDTLAVTLGLESSYEETCRVLRIS